MVMIDQEQQAEFERDIQSRFAEVVSAGIRGACVLICALALVMGVVAVACAEDSPAPTSTPNSPNISKSSPDVTFRVVPEILTGFVGTRDGSTPYASMRITATRWTSDAGQQLRIEGSTHQGGDAKDPRNWIAADLIGSAWRYVVADVALVGTVGSSVPLEGGRPVASKAYPLMAGALIGWMPRDHSFRVAWGAGLCQEAGPGLHAITSSRITGPGLGPAGSALVVDGCVGKTSLVRVNVSVGIR
jgi:hypothetical protein